MEEQTPVVICAGVGPSHTIRTWKDGFQERRQQKALASCEEGVVGAFSDGEATVAAVDVRDDIRKQVYDIVVNGSGVGKAAGPEAGSRLRQTVNTRLL